MNRPIRSATVVMLFAVFMSSAQDARAWQPAASSQTTAQQIVFQPPVEGSCRAENDSVSRGRIVSISEREIVMITPQDRQVSFPTEGIRIIRTKDGEFQYEPASDDFRDAVRRASELDGVRIATVSIPQQSQPGAAQGFSNPNPPPVTQQGNGTGNNSQTYSSTPGFSNGPDSQSANPAVDVGNSTLRCTSCNNLIPADSRNGQTCPHCGVLWTANPTYQSAAVDTTIRPTFISPPVGGQGGPVPGAAQGGQAGQGVQAGQAGQIGQAGQPPLQPANVPPPLVGQGGGNFSFDTMPMWQKAAAFIAFLAILYLVVSNRR